MSASFEPTTQHVVLSAITHPMTVSDIMSAVPHLKPKQVKNALCQARKRRRVTYKGTCSRGGTYTLTDEGREWLATPKPKASPKQDVPAYPACHMAIETFLYGGRV
jgi:hypothetical protein